MPGFEGAPPLPCIALSIAKNAPRHGTSRGSYFKARGARIRKQDVEGQNRTEIRGGEHRLKRKGVHWGRVGPISFDFALFESFLESVWSVCVGAFLASPEAWRRRASRQNSCSGSRLHCDEGRSPERELQQRQLRQRRQLQKCQRFPGSDVATPQHWRASRKMAGCWGK